MNNWDKELPNLQFILAQELTTSTEFASFLFALDLQLTENLLVSIIDVFVYILHIVTSLCLLTSCDHL